MLLKFKLTAVFFLSLAATLHSRETAATKYLTYILKIDLNEEKKN